MRTSASKKSPAVTTRQSPPRWLRLRPALYTFMPTGSSTTQ